MFFNLHVAPSITTMGKSIISASITFFESFLANNVQFGSLDEVVTFIDNIRMEKAGRKLKDNDIIDENISLTKCFYKIMATTGYMWVPSEKEAMIIWDMLSRVSQEDLNRIYYKNNLFEFCENKKVSSFIVSMLMALKSPFLNPNKVPEEIKDHMNIFLGWVKEYVYYEYITLDKLDRIETMPRDTVLIVDTDSCIISLEAWYQFLADKTKGIDMAIKHQKYDVIKLIEADEFGDMPKKKVVELIDFDYDYDFYNDKLVATHRAVEPLKLIPQDGLRCSIIDIMSYTISQLILDYMRNFCDKHYSSSPGRKCLLIMKNEFLFKSILLTYVKKHYAANTLVQEGNMVPKNAALSVTGLELDKAGTPKSTADELKRILFEEILDSETGVDQMKILNSLAVLEKKIFKSLVSGETTYHKPARIKPMTSYAMPMRIQGIKAAYAYNTLRPADSDPIDLEKRNSLLIIKTKLDKKTVEDIKNDDPAMYKKAVELLSAKEYKAGITSIAIQFGDPIPEWIIRFIDYDNIINDNLKGFPTDEVGINTLGNGNIPYTNLLTL